MSSQTCMHSLLVQKDPAALMRDCDACRSICFCVAGCRQFSSVLMTLFLFLAPCFPLVSSTGTPRCSTCGALTPTPSRPPKHSDVATKALATQGGGTWDSILWGFLSTLGVRFVEYGRVLLRTFVV